MYQAPQGRVLVRPVSEEMSLGGLYLPQNDEYGAMKGTVMSVGDPLIAHDGKCIPVPFQEGDTVLFGQLSGKRFEDEGEEI